MDVKDGAFGFYLRFVKPLLFFLPNTKDRVVAAAWVRKLVSEENVEEKLKTDYLKLLLFALQRKRLVGLFKQPPDPETPLDPLPSLNLQSLAKQLLQEEEAERKLARSCKANGSGDYPPYRVEYSTDLLEYAVAQEIPNFGTQIYYAVSKQPLPLWDSAEKGIYPKTAISAAEGMKDESISNLAGELFKTKSFSSKSDNKSGKSSRRTSKSKSEPETPEINISRQSSLNPSSKVEEIPKPINLGVKLPKVSLGSAPNHEDRNPPTWASNLITVTEPHPRQEKPSTPSKFQTRPHPQSYPSQTSLPSKKGNLVKKSRVSIKQSSSKSGSVSRNVKVEKSHSRIVTLYPGKRPTDASISSNRSNVVELFLENEKTPDFGSVDAIEDVSLSERSKRSLQKKIQDIMLEITHLEAKIPEIEKSQLPLTTPQPSLSPRRRIVSLITATKIVEQTSSRGQDEFRLPVSLGSRRPSPRGRFTNAVRSPQKRLQGMQNAQWTWQSPTRTPSEYIPVSYKTEGSFSNSFQAEEFLLESSPYRPSPPSYKLPRKDIFEQELPPCVILDTSPPFENEFNLDLEEPPRIVLPDFPPNPDFMVYRSVTPDVDDFGLPLPPQRYVRIPGEPSRQELEDLDPFEVAERAFAFPSSKYPPNVVPKVDLAKMNEINRIAASQYDLLQDSSPRKPEVPQQPYNWQSPTKTPPQYAPMSSISEESSQKSFRSIEAEPFAGSADSAGLLPEEFLLASPQLSPPKLPTFKTPPRPHPSKWIVPLASRISEESVIDIPDSPPLASPLDGGFGYIPRDEDSFTASSKASKSPRTDYEVSCNPTTPSKLAKKSRRKISSKSKKKSATSFEVPKSTPRRKQLKLKGVPENKPKQTVRKRIDFTQPKRELHDGFVVERPAEIPPIEDPFGYRRRMRDLQIRMENVPQLPREPYPEELLGYEAPVDYQDPYTEFDNPLPVGLPSPIKPEFQILGWETPPHLRRARRLEPQQVRFAPWFTNVLERESPPQEFSSPSYYSEDDREFPLVLGMPGFVEDVFPRPSPSPPVNPMDAIEAIAQRQYETLFEDTPSEESSVLYDVTPLKRVGKRYVRSPALPSVVNTSEYIEMTTAPELVSVEYGETPLRATPVYLEPRERAVHTPLKVNRFPSPPKRPIFVTTPASHRSSPKRTPKSRKTPLLQRVERLVQDVPIPEGIRPYRIVPELRMEFTEPEWSPKLRPPPGNYMLEDEEIGNILVQTPISPFSKEPSRRSPTPLYVSDEYEDLNDVSAPDFPASPQSRVFPMTPPSFLSSAKEESCSLKDCPVSSTSIVSLVEIPCVSRATPVQLRPLKTPPREVFEWNFQSPSRNPRRNIFVIEDKNGGILDESPIELYESRIDSGLEENSLGLLGDEELVVSPPGFDFQEDCYPNVSYRNKSRTR